MLRIKCDTIRIFVDWDTLRNDDVQLVAPKIGARDAVFADILDSLQLYRQAVLAWVESQVGKLRTYADLDIRACRVGLVSF